MTDTRQVVVVELSRATVRALNGVAKRLQQTRAAVLRTWILATLATFEGADDDNTFAVQRDLELIAQGDYE